MGCVLGTTAAGESRRNDKERRTSHSARVSKDGEKTATRIAQPPGPPDDRRNPRRQHQQPPPPPPQKLCNLSSFAANSATNQQGWPLWLVDVAGDAIKDWTPRRANTFEKLDKVLIQLQHLCNCTLSIYKISGEVLLLLH